MAKLIDLTGQRFGRWTAITQATGTDARSYVRWMCRCDCGQEKFVARVSLKNGQSQSCGCLQKELIKERRTDHGLSRTPEYYAWKNMHARCYDTENIGFHNYGGRGIEVCPTWADFKQFYLDMGERPQGLSLDRVNNALNYCKDNCRWATRSEQGSNTRVNRLITYKGQTLTVSEWARKIEMNVGTLAKRLDVWTDLDLVFNSPTHSGHTPPGATN